MHAQNHDLANFTIDTLVSGMHAKPSILEDIVILYFDWEDSMFHLAKHLTLIQDTPHNNNIEMYSIAPGLAPANIIVTIPEI